MQGKNLLPNASGAPCRSELKSRQIKKKVNIQLHMIFQQEKD